LVIIEDLLSLYTEQQWTILITAMLSLFGLTDWEKLGRNKEENKELSSLYVVACTMKGLKTVKTASIVNISMLWPDFTWAQQTRSLKFHLLRSAAGKLCKWKGKESHICEWKLERYIRWNQTHQQRHNICICNKFFMSVPKYKNLTAKFKN
jgi:hypothetical protein